MTLHRRAFLTTTTRAAASAAFVATLPRVPQGRKGAARSGGVPAAPEVMTLHDPQVKALAMSAVDAARQAGAQYADVRITYTRQRVFPSNGSYSESEMLGLSVRALVSGYWGWAATPYVAASEAPRVAQAAVGLAKGNSATKQPRHVEWTPIPVVADGAWMTPLREDPFEVAIPQALDWAISTSEYLKDAGATRGLPPIPEVVMFSVYPLAVNLTLQKQERVFASTEGSYCTQTVYVTDPHVGFMYRGVPCVLPIRPAQTGYEYVTDTLWQELIRQRMDQTDEELRHPLPFKLLDIGRYDVLFGASAMAALVAETVGTAAQVDRALGYEANARGTSYLGPDPLACLGTAVASPLVTVTADRTAPKALATTQWDEEGVRTEAFPLIQDGILQDYQTTREQAAWLAPYYRQHGRPVQSHGCAAGADALTQPLQHMPNLTLQPGKEAVGLEEMIASLDDGLVVDDVSVEMDFQALSGLALVGAVTKVRHGKRVAQVGRAHLAIMVRSPELWKHVLAVGGPQSVEGLYPRMSTKGEPEQQVRYSVSAVPALIKQLPLVDYTR